MFAVWRVMDGREVVEPADGDQVRVAVNVKSQPVLLLRDGPALPIFIGMSRRECHVGKDGDTIMIEDAADNIFLQMIHSLTL